MTTLMPLQRKKIENLPANKEPELMRHLLEMNWSGTFETCF